MAWLRLIRFALAPSTLADVAAASCLAYAYAYAYGVAVWPTILWAMLISFCLYVSGMIMNGIVDLEQDRHNAPGRPLPSGEISSRAANRAMYGAMIVAVLIALNVSLKTLVVTLVILAGISLYHVATKNHRILGPLTLGLIRAGNFVLGAVALGAGSEKTVLCAAGAYGIYVVGASWVAAREDDDLLDPRQILIGAALSWSVLFGVALIGVYQSGVNHVGVLAIPIAVAVLAEGVRRFRRLNPKGPLRPFAGWLLTGFYVYDGLIALLSGYLGTSLGIFGLFALSRALSKRLPPS